MLVTKDTQVPGLREAQAVQAEIDRLGVRDVKLFFDGEIGIWAVCQVTGNTSGFVTLDNPDGSRTNKSLMFYCKNDIGAYRPPNQNDVNDVIAVVRRAQETFKRGGDWFADKLDKQDEERRKKKEEQHKERVRPHMKRLKRAIREELG
jgi:hypothetical protein